MARPALMAAALFLIAVPVPAAAQANAASIRGTVVDSSGAAVPRVSVTAINDATGVKVSTATNDEGIYSFPVLNPGTYTISAELTGFKKEVHRGIELQLNQVVRIDLALELGSISDQVVVEARTPLVENETSSLGRVVSTRDVGELPLNQRNFAQLATLMPGSNFGAAARPSGYPPIRRGEHRRLLIESATRGDDDRIALRGPGSRRSASHWSRAVR